MAYQTHSRARTTTEVETETETVKRGATRKPIPVPNSGPLSRKEARVHYPWPEKERDKLPVLQFMNLPIDLLIMIAKYFHPLDIINLSRTTKLLRNMFMHRLSAGIWRAALDNVGLPPCPDESMPEPQYAALIFLEQCSECCKPGNHHIDPILLVRLCCSCRKNMVLSAEDVGEVENVLIGSEHLMPPWGRICPKWYLRPAYEDMIEKSRNLKGGVADLAWYEFLNGRSRAPFDRSERAKPLIKWLEVRTSEHKEAINKMQQGRAVQVEARLLELGWNQKDIQEGENYCDEWASLVCSTKPLNDKDWEAMLPYLLDALEGARETRLKDEARRRAFDRERMVTSWLCSLFYELGSLYLTFHWNEVGSKDTLEMSLYPQGIEKQDVSIQLSLMPYRFSWSVAWSPQVKEILNKDVPPEEFQLKFQRKQDSLKNNYINWRYNLEAALIQTIPEWKNLKPVELQSPSFILTATSNGDLPNSNGYYSLDLRKLLRADVRFSSTDPIRTLRPWSGLHYTDIEINGWTIETRRTTYSVAFSRIAKAIVYELGRPDASYLEMRGLGKSFLCCRCAGGPIYHAWDDIIDHYSYHNERGLNSLHCLDNGQGEPLVSLVAEPDQAPCSEDARAGCCLT